MNLFKFSLKKKTYLSFNTHFSFYFFGKFQNIFSILTFVYKNKKKYHLQCKRNNLVKEGKWQLKYKQFAMFVTFRTIFSILTPVNKIIIMKRSISCTVKLDVTFRTRCGMS